ncbi:MAG: hypothetical protein JWM86_1409 [Thermoleophilia bacterium]|nr:hypothetical protein [Thermoleophilia bacterium]
MIRRMFVRWIPVVALAIAATLVSAPAAQADVRFDTRACPAIYPVPAYCYGDRDLTRLAPTSHVGWVYLNLNYCGYAYACAAIHRFATPAWSWNGSAWTRSSIRGGWVYVSPYTGSWRWAWTQESGWVALDSGRFEIRAY